MWLQLLLNFADKNCKQTVETIFNSIIKLLCITLNVKGVHHRVYIFSWTETATSMRLISCLVRFSLEKKYNIFSANSVLWHIAVYKVETIEHY